MGGFMTEQQLIDELKSMLYQSQLKTEQLRARLEALQGGK